MVQYILGEENLTKNPSAEIDLVGWEPVNGNLTRTTISPLYIGSAVFRLESTSSTASVYMQKVGTVAPGPSSADHFCPILAGQTYFCQAQALSGLANVGVRLQASFYTAAWGFIESIFGHWHTLETVNKWYKVVGVMLAPANAAWVAFKIHTASSAQASGQPFTNLTTGNVIRIDAVMEKVNSPIIEYTDGSLGAIYSWLGTPHNSTSVRAARVLENSIKGSRQGVIKFTPSMWKATKQNEMLQDISEHITGGKVELRTDRLHKWSCAFTIKNPTGVLEPYTDFIAPFLELEYPNGDIERRQLGLYSLEPSGSKMDEDITLADLEGIDITWELGTTIFTTPYTIAAGTNVVGAMKAILNAAGFTRHSIPDSTKTQVATRTWDRGATKLQVLNDLAEYIGYYTLSGDFAGVITSFPYRNLATTQPHKKFFSGSGSDVVGTIVKSPSLETVSNVVRVIQEGATPAETIDVIARNDNPDSRVSTVSLQRELYREIQLSDVADAATALKIAQRALEEASSLYTNYTVQTFPDIHRSIWEVYEADLVQLNGSPAIQGKLRSSGWEIGFDSRSILMSHFCNRLELF